MLNLRRILITISLLVFSMPLLAGNFFPPDYKTFPFKEGDLISSKDRDGKFSVSKILKVDNVTIKKGSSINIQSKSFTATEDDFLLIISTAYGKHEFRSLEEAKVAAKNKTWNVELGHIPNRAPGAAEGQTLVGHSPVLESELGGYKTWKTAFEKGDAGVF